jgi:hypothetical protein
MPNPCIDIQHSLISVGIMAPEEARMVSGIYSIVHRSRE